MTSPRDSVPSTFAYTRFEPLNDDDESLDLNTGGLEFHKFEEEEPSPRPSIRSNLSSKRLSFSRLSLAFKPFKRSNKRSQKSTRAFTVSNGNFGGQRTQQNEASDSGAAVLWEFAIRFLSGAIIFGIGWIVGFVVRWGVHKYHTDYNGHCVSPGTYSYNPDLALEAMNHVKLHSIMNFFNNFTANGDTALHKIGSQESEEFAKNISEQWKRFGLEQVNVESIIEKIPMVSQPSEITIRDANGKKLWSSQYPEEDSHVS